MGGQGGNNNSKIQIQLKERESNAKKEWLTELCSKKEFILANLPRHLYMNERKPKSKHTRTKKKKNELS